MRPFFLCITLLAASITALQPPAGETPLGEGDNLEAGTNTGAGTIPEAGTNTEPVTIPGAAASNLEPTPEAEAAASNPRAWGTLGQTIVRFGAKVNGLRKQDWYWTGTKEGDGNIRPANTDKGEKPKGLSTFISKQAAEASRLRGKLHETAVEDIRKTDGIDVIHDGKPYGSHAAGHVSIIPTEEHTEEELLEKLKGLNWTKCKRDGASCPMRSRPGQSTAKAPTTNSGVMHAKPGTNAKSTTKAAGGKAVSPKAKSTSKITSKNTATSRPKSGTASKPKSTASRPATLKAKTPGMTIASPKANTSSSRNSATAKAKAPTTNAANRKMQPSAKKTTAVKATSSPSKATVKKVSASSAPKGSASKPNTASKQTGFKNVAKNASPGKSASKPTTAKSPAAAKNVAPAKGSIQKTATKSKPTAPKQATPKQARPAQNAVTKQAPISKAVVKKTSAAPAAAVPAKIVGKHRRSEIVPMNRIRMVQQAIQERDMEEMEPLQG